MLIESSPGQIIISVVCSVAAIMALGSAIVGYCYHHLGILDRLIFGIAAAFLFATVIADNNAISLLAMVFYIAVVFWQRSRAKTDVRSARVEAVLSSEGT